MTSQNFRYQHFVAVFGNRGAKVPVVDGVLSSHEQQIYPTTSPDENSIEFEFQTDRNYYVDLRQSYVALKLKLVKGRGYDKVKEAKKEHNVDDVITEDADNDTTNEVTVPFISHVHNNMHSVFSNVEVYINNRQIYNSNGLYAHKSYVSNNFKGAISE